MEIQKKTEGDIVILSISGELDLYNAPELKDSFQALIEEKKYKIIIDLDRVSYIDSSGIGALISSYSNLKKFQGQLRICNIAGTVKKVFELTKLTTFFQMDDTLENSISALKK